MIAIDEVLISEELLEEQFVCNLKSCKGACCWEGDFGAPLDQEEKEILDKIYPAIKSFLEPAGQKKIESGKAYRYYRGMPGWGTELLDNGACVFMTRDHLGIASCGIEQAWKAGLTSFQKPISCHLYPVRVNQNKKLGFLALNYDRWDICKAACKLGSELKIPVFRFVKAALIRKFGTEFYEALEACYLQSAKAVSKKDDSPA